MKLRPLFSLLLFSLTTPAVASVDPFSLSLEQLMEIPVAVASRKALSQRNAPGIVSVITSEDIRNSGARDLIDVLRLVPGFDFRVMLNNGVGLGMRGMIGSDGRVLMLVDGIEMNEHRYGTTIFGQGFPVEQIARIEIARGSALALYGGAAELGVINIITHDAAALDGMTIGGGLGYATDSGRMSRDQFHLMMGKKRDRFSWDFKLHTSHNMRSDRTYTGYVFVPPASVATRSYDLADENSAAVSNLNTGLQIGDFNARFIHDEPRFDDRDGPGYIRTSKANSTFTSSSLLLNYKADVTPTFSIAPNILIQDQNPRKTTEFSGVTSSETTVRRRQVRLPFAWDISSDLHFAFGLEHIYDRYNPIARAALSRLAPIPYSSTEILTQYGELLWKNPWGNLVSSFRLDDHSHAGKIRAVRLGYNKMLNEDWHIKLAGSHAGTAPWIESYAAAGRLGVAANIERSRSWETELGYKIDSNSQATLNLFDITTFDTFVLTNYAKVRSRGLEASYKTRQHWGGVDVSYSYYNANGTNTTGVQPIDYYNSSKLMDSNKTLAFPAHKLTASMNYAITPNLSINPSLVYLGSRWGYTPPGSFTGVTVNGTLREFGSTPLVNVALNWQSSNNKINTTLGLYNALNKNYEFIQPYNGAHAPLPDMSREVLLRAQFKLD